ncbi:MAG TPA: hypothetical protein VJC18_00020, partial [bacterium]|nr:hypothetical protein [bacterium]
MSPVDQSPLAVFELVFVLIQSGQYQLLSEEKKDIESRVVGVLSRNPKKKPRNQSIDDAFDVQEIWSGSSHVHAAYDDYQRIHPSFEQINWLFRLSERIADAGDETSASNLRSLCATLIQKKRRLQNTSLRRRIHEKYGLTPFRQKDSFLQHVQKLGCSESALLPTTPALLKEVMALMNLPVELGGGWSGVIGYLREFPDSLIKTALCLRLSSETDILPKPNDEEGDQFVALWQQSLDATLPLVEKNGFFEPDENGVFAKYDRRGITPPTIQRPFVGSANTSTCHYFQTHWVAMLTLMPHRSERPQAVAKGSRTLVFNPQLQLLRLDSLAPNLAPLDRTQNLKLVLRLVHDSRLIPLSVQVDWVAQHGDISDVNALTTQIVDTCTSLPPAFRSAYIPLFLQLSLRALDLNHPGRADALYKQAHEISQALESLTVQDLQPLFFYCKASLTEQKFDLGTRLREIKSSWEVANLDYLTRRYQRVTHRESLHLAQEISRIAENESIFDALESSAFRRTAETLDARGEHDDLVIRLYERAIQCRVREEYERILDFDWRLVKSIDLCGLTLKEKDRLLTTYLKLTLQRAVGPSVQEMLDRIDFDDHTTLKHRERAQQLLQPFHALLDMVEDRGYLMTEESLWQALDDFQEHILRYAPTSLQPVLCGVLANIAILRNPAIVDPA